MKNLYFLVKGWCLVVTLLMTIPFMGQATETSRLFKARRQTNLVRSFSTQLTHSDTIPLQNMSAIYALSIDATITQPREASFVRIVLEDTEGHDYLVAESDRFRNDTTLVQFTEYCEETARLDGITPTRLKCYLAGDATLTVTGIHASDQIPTRGENTSMETASAIKEAQVQNIVDRINEYNARHGKLWCAGITTIAMMNFDDKMKVLGADISVNTDNIEYYSGGIFEFGSPKYHRNVLTESPYIDSFDWCNRHGKNWMTPIRDQHSAPYCTAFAVAAGLETMRNLYYNKPIMDHLSVQELACCAKYNPTPNSCRLSINVDSALIYSRDVGIMLDSIYPFEEYGLQICMSDEINPDEKIKINGYSAWQWQEYYSDDFPKWLIINYGPQVSWLYASDALTGDKHFNHAMLLVGYGQIHEGMQLNNYYPNSPHTNSIISANDPRIGMTYWKFKNSWGLSAYNGYMNGTYDGYMYMILDTLSVFYKNYSMLTPISSELPTDIIIEDLDGDGFFNWGIGSRPSNLPTWAEQEEDGDDSNRFKGAMNQYGYIADVNYSSPTIVIDHNMTDTELIDSIGCSRFLRRHIRIDPGVTFTIQGSLAFYSGKRIYMNNLSNLVIDGGTLVDPTLYKSAAGGKVVIKNGGKIVCHKKSSFVLPDEITMEMDEGSIFE